jgi:hypothetical protein
LSGHQRSAQVLTLKTKVTLHEQALPAFTLDVQKRLVIVQFVGTVTVDDIARYAKKLLADRKFQPTFSEITDLREVSELNLQANDFLRLADKVDPFWPEAKRAFVVRTEVQNHAARMHKILRSERKIEIFQSLEEAEKWIAQAQQISS